MIFDSHCHAWRRWPYDARVPDPNHRGSIGGLLYELDAAGVDRAAVVCARIGAGSLANDDNNDYVAAAACRHPDRLVVMADVDSRWLPEHHTPGAADRLRGAAERYELTAFTHYVHDEDDGWFGSDDGAEFFGTAADLGLVASLSVSPSWFPAVGAVAAGNPTLPILLHHLGHLRLDDPAFGAARAGLLALADRPNVMVKVSGFHYLTTPSWGFPYPDVCERVLRPIAHAFGPHRLAWGSDFPVARQHVSYAQSLAMVRDHTPWWTDAERALVLGGSLGRVGLDGPHRSP
ncbi:amidohydrolase family protein [Kribbella pittospori]|uniref:amidohydrolase family protein n=1 Tax=Kribbella pittospori TaxID=722689 RepID=UPI0013F3C2A2|nr:amidohydrolase family protein [Kribbella pittospori]